MRLFVGVVMLALQRETRMMSEPTTKAIDAALESIEAQELHPTRRLARGLVAEYRKGKAIDESYDFNAQSREQRQIFYNAAVRFRARHSLWSRLWRR